MNCPNSSLRIFPQPGQPLFSVRLVQRKYPVLFGTWVAFKAYPQCPHLIFPANQVFFGFSYVYLLGVTGNAGTFSGEKLFFRDFVDRFPVFGFSIMEETYGFNMTRYTGFPPPRVV